MAYRPQSPDLSALQQSQAFSGYRPQSPDLSGLHAQTAAQHDFLPPRQRHLSDDPFAAPIIPTHQTSEPFTNYQFQQQQQQPQPYAIPQVKHEALEYLPDAKSMLPPKSEPVDPTLGVVLKTSFPVARIKRIMQADEDIGKVAQVTPHVVSRALELFMIKLITASCEQARGGAGASASKGQRRVQVQHMKRAIQADDKFDFLAEIVSKVPDAPVKNAKTKDVGSDSEDAKPRKKAKRRKDDDD